MFKQQCKLPNYLLQENKCLRFYVWVLKTCSVASVHISLFWDYKTDIKSIFPKAISYCLSFLYAAFLTKRINELSLSLLRT